jgi:hypothetical protein
MTVLELYSKRLASGSKAGTPDPFVYDQFPNALRAQIVHIWKRALPVQYDEPWRQIAERIAEEHGKHSISKNFREFMAVFDYFTTLSEVPPLLDVIEVTFGHIKAYVEGDWYRMGGRVQDPEEAIKDLNTRLREHSVGYAYESGQIIRIDSQFLHSEVVLQALSLLQQPEFSGPNDEFLSAHEHYRFGKFKESIVDACKAFESTLKAICDVQKWHYDKDKDTAQKLIDIVLAKGLVAPHLQATFSSLRALLTTAVPTTRNRKGGHGQGAVPVVVPPALAAYALHMTAATIVFLVESYKSLT